MMIYGTPAFGAINNAHPCAPACRVERLLTACCIFSFRLTPFAHNLLHCNVSRVRQKWGVILRY